ncbi:hypothetical protein CORC01_05628 [Colletotrichum orchidophilum]|uniref:Uncharacterized protein n=1 Tax=Colletotrichum orchidophilum TaxID=1209926 RepID=A0A1G4BCS2_9PEZI|nr:uncharacterized protein CORC01_05628 [Colletotrichum orchidophilum]OHE99135.1 hypothetical protein CORC01_05628 [Colletotrichum orchidophilum]
MSISGFTYPGCTGIWLSHCWRHVSYIRTCSRPPIIASGIISTFRSKPGSFVELSDAGIREVPFRTVDEVRCPATREKTEILPGLQLLSNQQNLTSETGSNCTVPGLAKPTTSSVIANIFN